MTRHFNPLDAVIKPVDITYVEGQTLDKIIMDTVKDPIHQNLCQISIGGAVIPRQNWAHVKPKAGQILKVQIIPRGRGAAKVLRTVLTIAVIAVAAWVTGGAALGLLGGSFGAGTLGASVLGGLVGVVGQFAINAILPPPSPNRQQQEVDPLYTISGTRNQGRSDQVAPLILGRHRFTFDLLSQQYQQVVGENTYLVFLACVGVGNYDVQNIRIGDTPITEFNGVTIQRSLLIHSAPQTLLQGDFTQQNIGINLDNTSAHSRVVPAGTTDIDVILDFPRGLGKSDDRGRPERVSVGISVRYRQIGDTVWQDRAPDNGAEADAITNQLISNPLGRRRYYEQFSNIRNFRNAVPNSRRNQLNRSFTRSDNQPFRSSLRLALPPGPAYEIEVRRTTAHDNDVAVGNDVTWSLLGAWADRDLTPDPRMSVLAVRILATDQLSGFVDQLNGDVGKIIPTLSVDNPESFDPALISYDDWSELSVSLNPADILLDAILGPHTDNPHNLDAINFESLSAFWQWCHSRNYRFSLPLTSDVSRNELMDTICSAGRGRAYYYRGQLHIAIDRERLEGPRQVIGPENARNFVFSRSFGASNDALRVRFNNAENNYQEDLITVYREGKDETNANSFEDITLAGEVYPDQVFEKAQYIIDIADKANIIGRCEMDFEVETLQLGDYIRLQHPVLNAAASSGRVLKQTGQSIILSQPFEMDPNLDYVFVHRRIIGRDDDARIEVEGIYDLIPRAGQSDIVNLAAPLPADVVMAYDDLYVVGIKGQATFEALIQDIRPTSAYEAEVSFLTYLPDALTVPNIPAHRPITSSGFSGPPVPRFAGSNVNNDIISVLFDVPALSSGLIQEFQCAYRTSGQRLADDEGRSEWVEAASLPGTARAFRFPIVSMAQSYDVRISAIDYDGLASSPLIVKDIIFSDFLISPRGIQAFPSTQSNETGGSVPIVRFQFTPVENPDLTNFIIEHRRATENEFAPFNQIYAGPTSINEIDIHGLLPGAKCDFRFAFQHQRGPLTRIDLRPILSNITIPDSLVSSNTSHIGGVPSAVLLNEVAETLEANERLSNDVNNLFLSVEDGIRTSGLDRDFIAAAETRIAAIEDNAEDIQSEINIAHDQIIDDAASVSQSRSDILAIEDTVNETRTEVVSLRNQTAALNQTAQNAVTATANNVLITSGHVDETSENAEAVRQDRIAAQGARGAAEQIETNVATIRDDVEGFAAEAASLETLTSENRAIRDETQALRDDAENIRDSATTQAEISTDKATIATDAASAAREIASISARISNNFINPNASFADYPAADGVPSGWFRWQNGELGSRVDSRTGGYAYRQSLETNIAGGLFANLINGSQQVTQGWYIIDVEFTLVSGSLRGAGIHAPSYTATNANAGTTHNISFFHFIDPSTGQALLNGVVGRTYRISSLVHYPSPETDGILMFVMTAWGAFAGPTTPRTIDWHKAGIRAATQMEIDSGRVSEIEAQALISQNAIAENTGRNASFLEFNASSTAGETYAIIRSDSDTGRSIVLGTPELLITDDNGDNPRNFVRVQDGSIVASGDIEVGGGAFFGIGQGRIPFQLATRDFGNLRDGDVVQLNLPGAVNPTIRYRTDRLEPLGFGEQYDVSLQNLTPISGIVRAKIVASNTPVAVMATGDQAGGAHQPTRTLDKPYPDANSGEYSFTIRGVLQISRRVTTQSSGIPGQPSRTTTSYVGGFTLVTQFDTGRGYVQGPTVLVAPSDAGSPRAAGGFNFEKTFTVQFNDDIGQNSGREFGVSIFSGQNGADAITQIVSVEWSTAPQSGERSATTGGYRLSLSAEPANVPS